MDNGIPGQSGQLIVQKLVEVVNLQGYPFIYLIYFISNCSTGKEYVTIQNQLIMVYHVPVVTIMQ